MSKENNENLTFNQKFDIFTRENQVLKKIIPLLVYFLFFVLIDMFTRVAILGSSAFDILLVDFTNWGFCLFLAALIYILPKVPQIVVFDIISAFLLLYGFAQCCFIPEKDELMRFSTIGASGEGLKFAGDAINSVSLNIKIAYLIMLIMLIALTIFCAHFAQSKPPKPIVIAKAVILLLAGIWFVVSVYINAGKYFRDPDDGDLDYKYYQVRLFQSPSKVFVLGGYYDYIIQDIYSLMYNSIHSGDSVEMISEYFANEPEHINNEMTGIFKDKNLIIIQLESMDYTVFNETICPNLIKYKNESIYFPNFYTPRFGDTLTFGTETAIGTGLFSASGINESTFLEDHSFPYSLANIFRSDGYTANEFHFNDTYFYNRGKMSLTYGYEKYWKYSELLEDKTLNTEIDDVISKNGLYDKIIEGDRFLDLIITYSPHAPIKVTDERYIEAINRHPEFAVSDPNDDIGIFKAYCTLTDDAVGEFMQKLDEDGVLDSTVVMFITDHYAHSIYEDSFIQSQGEKVNNTPFFIYCKGIEPMTVEKVCKTNDVLPTILNLFGYDVPNKYLGEDIFDESYEGYAYFPSLSWITSECYYDDGKVVENYTDSDIDQDYINKMCELTRKLTELNTYMLYTDYYAQEK